MKTTELDRRRSHWLKTAKHICVATLSRAELLRSTCGDNTDKARRAVSLAGERLHSMLRELGDIEKGALPLGAYSLFPDGAEEHVHHAIVLLIGARLCDELGVSVGSVGDIVDLVSGRDAEVALATRALFRIDGLLRPHVNIEHRTRVLDQLRVSLRESIFNLALGIEPDVEFLVIEGDV